MTYEKVLLENVTIGMNIALPVKDQSFYLTSEGEVKRLSTVRIFNVVGIQKNNVSKTFTVEVLEINATQNVQPLILDQNADVFKINMETVIEDPEEKETKDNRKVIKG